MLNPLSPDSEAVIRDRLRRRANLIFPGSDAQAVLPEEAVDDNVDVVYAVRRATELPFAGFVRVSAQAFRSPEPLYAVIGRANPVLGRAFSPGRIFGHVGERLCFRREPGLREECWVREGRGLESRARAAAASPFALAWITAGGIGFLPVVGATLASLATALLALGAGCWLAWDDVRIVDAAVCAVATLASLLVEQASARHFLSNDAREFVLDEVAGMALTLAFVPQQAWPWGVAVAFCAFRFFDVLKPGIAWVERRNWRGTIVWDDLLAGLYAGVCTAGVVWIISCFTAES